MPTVHLSPIFNGWQGFGNTGLPLNGGGLYTYAAGTATPTATYTTSAGNVANPFPIPLDSAGRLPNEVWLAEGTAYKFIVTDSTVGGNILATYDNIVGIHDFLAGTPAVTFGGQVAFNSSVTMSGNLTFDGVTNPRIKGDFSNATIASRLLFQTTTAAGETALVAIPQPGSNQSSFNTFNNSDPANAGFFHIAISAAEASIQSSRTGVGVTLPMTFYCGNSGAAETMRLTTAQQVLIGTTSSPTNGSLLRVGGLVQIDNAAAFLVTTSAAINIPNTTFTQVPFNVKAFDQGTYFNVASGKFTPPAGKYCLMVNAGNTGAVDQARFLVMIYKNGAVVASFNTAASGVAAQNAHISAVVDANGTDFFEGYVWQNSGGAYTLSNTAQDTYFCGYRIG